MIISTMAYFLQMIVERNGKTYCVDKHDDPLYINLVTFFKDTRVS